MLSRKIFQQGHSMLELLGVLALVGVLSIGAFAGFRKALDKHTANQIIEDVRLAGFVVKDEHFDNMPLNQTQKMWEDFTPQTNYSYETYKESETTFALLVSPISERVCRELQHRKVKWLEEISANSLENICQNDENTLYFYFNVDLDGNTAFESKECRINAQCPDSMPYCVKGICRPCPAGHFLKDKNCLVCKEIGFETGVSRENCHVCENMFFTADRWCFGCSDSNGNTASTIEECRRCPNRCYRVSDGKCVLAENEIIQPDGTCATQCSIGQFLITTNAILHCVDCKDTTFELGATRENCHTCENMFLSSSNWCWGCGSGDPIDTSLEECQRCSRRHYNPSDLKCYLCPNGQKASSDGLSCINE